MMSIKRRHLLQHGISALVGLGLAKLDLRSVDSQELPKLRQGRFGLIPAQLSQRFFEGILYPNPSIKDSYDRLVAKGFKFATDALVGTNLTDPNNSPIVFSTLLGKKAVASADSIEFAIISTIYINKTLFDLGSSTSVYSAKTASLQTVVIYPPNTPTSSELQIDRELTIAGTASELANRLVAKIDRAYGKNSKIDSIYPNLSTAGLSGLQLSAALDSIRQQIGREEFLTPTQDKYLSQKLNLAIRSLGLNRQQQATVTLPLAIELASAANLIGNARRLDSNPVIMPRQSEIPEPSYRDPGGR
jgi:hypothetical protein